MVQNIGAVRVTEDTLSIEGLKRDLRQEAGLRALQDM